MGSLFDGIGGFPLAAIHNGVIPLWVSEIEPFPIRVTQQRLPGMLHYGDLPELVWGDPAAGGHPLGVTAIQDRSRSQSWAGRKRLRSGSSNNPTS